MRLEIIIDEEDSGYTSMGDTPGEQIENVIAALGWIAEQLEDSYMKPYVRTIRYPRNGGKVGYFVLKP